MAGRRAVRRAGLRALIGEPCPVCGARIDNIYAKTHGNGQTYYYAYHKGGKQCYLGPDTYIYVTRTHKDINMYLRGAVAPERLVEYIETLAEHVNVEEMDEEDAKRIIKAVAKLMRRWQAYKQRKAKEAREAKEEEVDAVSEWERFARRPRRGGGQA